MAKRRCKGKTKAGTRCTRRGSEWCAQHAVKAARPDSDRTPKRRARKDDWRPRFLAAFEEHVTVSEACRVAGVSRANVYEERVRDESFATAWSEIEERSTEQMEREAYRRAVEGWIERGIYDDEGEQIGEVRKFSDTLLIFMLKARRPATYREHHTVEHTGPGGGPVPVALTLDAKARKALGDVLRSRPATRAGG